MSYGRNANVARFRNDHTPSQSVRDRVRLVSREDMKERGTVKWFDDKRGFGFLRPDSGGPDIFVHKSVLQKYGVRPIDMIPDLPIRFNSEPKAGGRPEALCLAI